jgi:hypothetical protein
MTDSPVRLAVWSGPRNISTALMRSFGSRKDTIVLDEPLYAHYLSQTGAQHPGRAEILSSQPTTSGEAIKSLFAPLPKGIAFHFQKHMAHHLLPSIPRAWLRDVRHAILIRNPAEVIASYTRVVAQPTALDLGYPQLSEIFELAASINGSPPPVVDARDLLANPPSVLASLCRAIGMEFDPCMLTWEKGTRPTDGKWAPYWYGNVEKSTAFQPFEAKQVCVPDALMPTLAECQRHYEELWKHRITA